jgi:class 3 adenylate cyclase
MSVALENARLFDETQRLFRAEQQRAAELAILIDQYTSEGLPPEIHAEALGPVLFKGKQQAINIFSVGAKQE